MSSPWTPAFLRERSPASGCSMNTPWSFCGVPLPAPIQWTEEKAALWSRSWRQARPRGCNLPTLRISPERYPLNRSREGEKKREKPILSLLLESRYWALNANPWGSRSGGLDEALVGEDSFNERFFSGLYITSDENTLCIRDGISHVVFDAAASGVSISGVNDQSVKILFRVVKEPCNVVPFHLDDTVGKKSELSDKLPRIADFRFENCWRDQDE